MTVFDEANTLELWSILQENDPEEIRRSIPLLRGEERDSALDRLATVRLIARFLE